MHRVPTVLHFTFYSDRQECKASSQNDINLIFAPDITVLRLSLENSSNFHSHVVQLHRKILLATFYLKARTDTRWNI